MSEVQPVFLVGQRRSGTHLLQKLLNSHPEIAFPGDLNFTVAYDPAIGPDMGTVYEDLLARGGYWEYGVRPRFLGDFAAEMRAFVEDIGRKHGSRLAGGVVHFHLERLVTIWPEAKFIRIVRDVRDVYASARAMGLEGNAWSVATRWTHTEQIWDRLAASLGPEQALLVRYEDLGRDPDTETRRMFEFLGCDPHAALSADVDWASRQPATTSISGGAHNSRTSNSVIEAIAGAELQARGYRVRRGPLSQSLVRVLSPLMAWHDKIWRRRVAIRSYGLVLIGGGFLARRLRLRRVVQLIDWAMIGRDEETVRRREFRYARSHPPSIGAPR